MNPFQHGFVGFDLRRLAGHLRPEDRPRFEELMANESDVAAVSEYLDRTLSSYGAPQDPST